MEAKYENLRSKMIFDFTRNEKILKEILDETDFSDYMGNPKEFIENEYIEGFTEFSKIFDLVLYSSLVQDKMMYNLLKEEFLNDYPEAFEFSW